MLSQFRHAKHLLIPLLVLQMLIRVSPTFGMNFPHYNLESLVYMSTDIVIVTLSEDEQHNFAGIVAETLYGPLGPGDRVERLYPFLTFFRPIENGMRVILFLDRRPKEYDFIHQDAAKSPFAVLPSGVMFIDKYDHVHRYFQVMSPGPYVAQGYDFFTEKKEPTMEEDLKLPSLASERDLIFSSLKNVEKMRPLLDKTATRDDVRALLALLNMRASSEVRCSLGSGTDGISARLNEQIAALQDPELLLTLYPYRTNWDADISFVRRTAEPDTEFSARRVQYLTSTIADKKRQLSHRIAAAEILVSLARWRDASRSGPVTSWSIDNQWLAPSASQIREVARKVFDDRKENPKLRSVCLRLLPLDDEKTERDVREVYARTQSAELRFAIDEAFLQIGDEVYQRLKPIGGPASSIVMQDPEYRGEKTCAQKTALLAKYHLTKASQDQREVFQAPHITLTNIKTGERDPNIEINRLSGWLGGQEGGIGFELRDEQELPPGKYSLSVEFRKSEQVISAGYKMQFFIVASKHGRTLEVMPQ